MTTVCLGCGVALPDLDYPTHAYLTSSPACWSRFNEALTLHYSNALHWPAHQLLTDAYTLQHSNGEDRRAQRSLVIHLVGLACQVERGISAGDVVAFRRSVAQSDNLPVLTPPRAYAMTIADISLADDVDEHRISVEQYARAVWLDWQKHHALALAMLNEHRSA